MKLSIVIPVLDSHEIVRRQMLHWGKILTKGVEVILVDDGSNPPIKVKNKSLKVMVLYTNNTTPWSEHAARNMGARAAKGDYLFMIDVDYIVTKEAIEKILAFNGVRLDIERRFGVLDKRGKIVTDPEALVEEHKLRTKYATGEVVPGHRSQYVMKKEVFIELGGYREDLAGENHPNGGGAGQQFNGKWRKYRREHGLPIDKVPVYMFPSGKFCVHNNPNPAGLFHNLKREKYKKSA